MKKILIVDDIFITGYSISRCIQGMGMHHIDIATSYSEAVTYIIENDYDLLILDINLGGSNNSGIDLVKEYGIGLDIIFCSSYSEQEASKLALDLDTIGYVRKPFRNESLIKVLRNSDFFK